MRYDFKFWAELGWALLIGATITLLLELTSFRPEAIEDWRAWAIVLGGAVVRGAVAVAGTKITELLRSG